MKIVISILHRVLVTHFYRVNAGFFLFMFFVLFGLPYQPLSLHLSLIKGILQSEIFLLFVMMIWLLYNLKCINYILKQLDHPQQNFLFCINNLPLNIVYASMIYVHIMVYMPVLIYTAVIFVMALKQHRFICALQVLLFDGLMMAASARLYLQRLQKRNIVSDKIALPSFRIKVARPLYLIPLLFLWHDRKQMLLVTKVFSSSILIGFINLYEPEQHDIRPLELCLLLCVGAHSAIVLQLRGFEEEYLGFLRSLPVHTTRKFISLVVTLFILLLPECMLLLKGYHIHFNWYDYPQLLLLSLSLLLMFYVTLLMDEMNMDQFMPVMFGIMTVCFFTLLYSSGLVFSVVAIALAYTFYAVYYYSFEKKS